MKEVTKKQVNKTRLKFNMLIPLLRKYSLILFKNMNFCRDKTKRKLTKVRSILEIKIFFYFRKKHQLK